jgi:hypothetical protein
MKCLKCYLDGIRVWFTAKLNDTMRRKDGSLRTGTDGIDLLRKSKKARKEVKLGGAVWFSAPLQLVAHSKNGVTSST